MTPPRKKLIEVLIPLEAINVASAPENIHNPGSEHILRATLAEIRHLEEQLRQPD